MYVCPCLHEEILEGLKTKLIKDGYPWWARRNRPDGSETSQRVSFNIVLIFVNELPSFLKNKISKHVFNFTKK